MKRKRPTSKTFDARVEYKLLSRHANFITTSHIEFSVQGTPEHRSARVNYKPADLAGVLLLHVGQQPDLQSHEGEPHLSEH